jgi:malate dehydrogenase (oxaloacetate-decarboxylating)
VGDGELREDYIIPSVFNRDVAPAVAEAVAESARRTGAAAERQNTIGFAAVDAQAHFGRSEAGVPG